MRFVVLRLFLMLLCVSLGVSLSCATFIGLFVCRHVDCLLSGFRGLAAARKGWVGWSGAVQMRMGWLELGYGIAKLRQITIYGILRCIVVSQLLANLLISFKLGYRYHRNCNISNRKMIFTCILFTFLRKFQLKYF